MTRKLDLLLAAALAVPAAPALAADREEGREPGVSQGFLPPAQPMILTREVRRSLVDGKQFVSRRSYAIRFVPAMNGYVVEGTLIASEVDAPPALMQLAELERTREGGPFPLLLDSAGLITGQRGGESPGQVQRTMTAATSALAASSLSAAEQAAALRMVAQLQSRSSAAGVTWPANLFRPPVGTHSEARTLPTDAGGGRVVITTESAADHGGLLRRFERHIDTEVAGSHRRNIESWTLSPAP